MKQKALLLESKQGSFVLSERDVPTPHEGQLLIKIEAAALNPVDFKIQEAGGFVSTYPAILGSDMAGIVEEVGEGVRDFVKGDRVFAHADFDNDQSSFQQHAIGIADLTCKIPPNLDFDRAATVPLGFDTAAVGLYSEQLGAGLAPPWKEGQKGKYAGKPILIMGGSSSVGNYAIQLAKLSGFSPIITTATPANEACLKEYGATHVIDRNLTGDEFIAALQKITREPIEVEYDAISLPNTQKAAWSVLAQGGTLALTLQALVREEGGKGRKVVTTYGNPHAQSNQTMCHQYWAILEEWLKDGSIKPNKLEVLPDGLNAIPGGLERMKEGKISGKKLVVHPQETA